MPTVWFGDGSYNGLSWGLSQPTLVVDLTGLDDMPAVRTTDAPRGSDHGVFGGNDYMDERVVTFTLLLMASTQASYATLLRQALAAFTPSINTDLPVYVNDNTRVFFGRPRRRMVQQAQGGRGVTGTLIVEMHCRDPRVYDANLTTLSTGLANPGAGFAFAISFPITFGAGPVGGSFNFTNAGNFGCRPVFTIAGPVVNPNIQNVTSGQGLYFSIVLATGDSLVVDTDARSVVLNGAAGRRNALNAGSQWFELAPGLSTVAFQAFAYTSTPTLQMTTRSAWI